MAWQPREKVTDFSRVIDNLVAYLEANQTDALAWAAGSVDVLEDYQKIYPNASGRLATLFPLLMVVRQEQANDLSGDVLISAVELLLEGHIVGSDTDALTLKAKQYALATESMLANIPPDTLTDDSLSGGYATLLELETAFDVLRGNNERAATSFLQIFQIRCVYRLHTAGY